MAVVFTVSTPRDGKGVCMASALWSGRWKHLSMAVGPYSGLSGQGTDVSCRIIVAVAS